MLGANLALVFAGNHYTRLKGAAMETSRKQFVQPTLTEEASLVEVTLLSCTDPNDPACQGV